ncbi:MAG: pantoate--beta-alanine ligase [Ilumatobacteraceae bacterium]
MTTPDVPAPLVLTHPDEMHEWSTDAIRAGRRIALVPTMGALHEGHLSLVNTARECADLVVVSIFVNPLQFGEPADFDRYPRPIDDDLDACAAAGVDTVYAPTAAAMYPEGFQTRVVAGPLADAMEGSSRPGHFDGVVTVVTKLFAAVRPDVAVFGEKDFQQLAVIRRLVVDLDLGVDIVGHRTVRGPDGLAMSSRNLRLTEAERQAARCIPQAVRAALDRAAERSASVDDVLAAARQQIIAEPAAALDYVTVFDAGRLTEVQLFDPERRRPGNYRLALAVRFGDIRLIDNADLFDALDV